jgi:hypothetical protein
MIFDHGRFVGQATTAWTAAGVETTLRINRALSISAAVEEQEDAAAERERVNLGWRRYQRVTVQGRLLLRNLRSEPVEIVIRRHFSGDLVEADGSPAAALLEEGAYSVNRRNELVWRLMLEPGAERTLRYRYRVLSPD